MMPLRRVMSVASVVVLAAGVPRAADDYPITVSVDAQAKSGVTTVTSKLTIHVDRMMNETGRTKVTDALKYGGYQNFMNALRPLPPVGTIETQSKKVQIRYTREQREGEARRLVLVADQPLFFFGADPAKSRTGYALTLVELHIDAKGGVLGTLSGAARVKPAGDGGVVLDDYAEAPVELKGTVSRP